VGGEGGRRGLVFKAHRLLHHSTLSLRVMKKKKEEGLEGSISGATAVSLYACYHLRCVVRVGAGVYGVGCVLGFMQWGVGCKVWGLEFRV